MIMQETTEKKPTCKNAGVSPTAWNEIPYKTWWGHVAINGEITFTKTYKSKKRAYNALQKLKEKLNYDSIETLQDEGCYPERVKIMRELYIKDGRESKDHPMYGFYTGLAEKDV
jgi:hypothetical protein